MSTPEPTPRPPTPVPGRLGGGMGVGPTPEERLADRDKERQAAHDAERSRLGLTIAQDFVAGVQPGTVINRTAFPEITQGPFGTVTTIRGGAIGGYSATGPATPLATFDVNGMVAVAAREFGAGRVAFFGDYDLVSRDDRDNVPLRRNTLSALLTPVAVPEPGSLVLGATGAVVLLGGAWLRRRWCLA